METTIFIGSVKCNAWFGIKHKLINLSRFQDQCKGINSKIHRSPELYRLLGLEPNMFGSKLK